MIVSPLPLLPPAPRHTTSFEPLHHQSAERHADPRLLQHKHTHAHNLTIINKISIHCRTWQLHLVTGGKSVKSTSLHYTAKCYLFKVVVAVVVVINTLVVFIFFFHAIWPPNWKLKRICINVFEEFCHSYSKSYSSDHYVCVWSLKITKLD